MRKPALTVAALVALLAGSAITAAAKAGSGQDGLMTEWLEPGVERIIRDDAGHDLDEKHPTYRYDMDGIEVTPDGTVWVTTTYSRTDNDAHPVGPHLWALDRPGEFTNDSGIPAPGSPTLLVDSSDGALLVIGEYDVARYVGDSLVPDEGPSFRQTPRGILALIDAGDAAKVAVDMGYRRGPGSIVSI